MTFEALTELQQSRYVLIDLRDETAFLYDHIPGAVQVPDLLEQAERKTIPQSLSARKMILYCMRGIQSEEAAETLRENGYDAESLEEGFSGYIRRSLSMESRQAEIEEGIRRVRRFHEKLFSPFARAVRDFQLVNAGDKVAVCISGGKDSMLMAKLFQELQRCRKVPFELVNLVMDPGYTELNRMVIEKNARMLGIPVTIFESPIFDTVDTLDKQACYTCARMRRGYLYKRAKELGCNKIALGHHYDDVIETILMAMLWGGQYQTMMPKLHSEHWEGMELIRPMYYIRESEIKAWRDHYGLHFLQCACHFTQTCSTCRDDGTSGSKRMETKRLIERLKETNPQVEANIFNSMFNINVDTVISYRKDGVQHHFLDDYE